MSLQWHQVRSREDLSDMRREARDAMLARDFAAVRVLLSRCADVAKQNRTGTWANGSDMDEDREWQMCHKAVLKIDPEWRFRPGGEG